MADVQEKLILDIATKNFQGTKGELLDLEAGLASVKKAISNAFSGATGRKALKDFEQQSISLGRSLKDVGKITDELTTNSFKVDSGAAVTEISKYEDAINKTLDSTIKLRDAMLAATGSAVGKARVSAAFDPIIAQAKSAAEDLRNLTAAATKTPAAAKEFVTGQVNAADERARSEAVAKVTEAIQRSSKAAVDAQATFSQLGISATGSATEAAKALEALAKAFSKVNANSTEQLVIGKDVEKQLQAEAVAASKLAEIRSKDLNNQVGLKQTAATNAFLSPNGTGQQKKGALDEVSKRIDSGELKTTLDVQKAITAELTRQQRLLATNKTTQAVNAEATKEEKKNRLEIIKFLTDEASKSGLLLKLKGDLRSVLAQTVSEAEKLKLTVATSTNELRDFLALNAESKTLERSGAPKQLNEFGIAFVAGFASQTLFASIGKVIAQLSAFEDELTNVRRTADATLSTSRELGQEILDIGQTVPVAATELAKAATALGQIGAFDFKNQDLAKGSAEFDKAAKAITLVSQTSSIAELDINTVALAYGQLQNVFEKDVTSIIGNLKDLGNKSADSADAMRVLFGAINEVSNKTAATSDNILQFAQRFGGLASGLGIAATDVISLGGVVRDLGITTEVAGTAFTRFFSRASQDADKFGKALGVSAEVFRSRFSRDALGTVLDTLDALKGKAKENSLAFQDFAGDLNLESREFNAFSKISQNLDLVRAGLKQTSSIATNYASVQVEAAKKTETWSSGVVKLNNAMLAFYETLRPAIDFLGKLVGHIATLIKGFSELSATPFVAIGGLITAGILAMGLSAIATSYKLYLLAQTFVSTALKAQEAKLALDQTSKAVTSFGANLRTSFKVGAAAAAMTALVSVASAGAVALSEKGKGAGVGFGTAFSDALLSPEVIGLVVVGGLLPLLGHLAAAIGVWAAAIVFSIPAALIGAAAVAVATLAAAFTGDLSSTLTAMQEADESEAAANRAAKSLAIRKQAYAEYSANLNSTKEKLEGLAQADKDYIAQLTLSEKKAEEAAEKVHDYASAMQVLRTETSSLHDVEAAYQALRARGLEIEAETLRNSTERAKAVKAAAAALAEAVNSSGLAKALDGLTPSAAVAEATKAATQRVEELSAALVKLKEHAKGLDGEDLSGVLDAIAVLLGKIGAAKSGIKTLKQLADDAAKADKEGREAASQKGLQNQASLEEATARRNELSKKGVEEYQQSLESFRTDLRKFSQEDPFTDLFDKINSERVRLIQEQEKVADKAITDGAGDAKAVGEALAVRVGQVNTAFLEKLQTQFREASAKAVKDIFDDMERAISETFKRRQILKDFERLEVLTKLRDEIEALSAKIEGFGETKRSVDDVTASLADFEAITSSGLDASGRSLDEFAKAAEKRVDSFAESISKLAKAYDQLGEKSSRAFKEAGKAAAQLKKNARQDAFDQGQKAGSQFIADRERNKDVGKLAASGTGSSIVQAVGNAVTSKGTTDEQKGSAAKIAIEEALITLRKQGRDQEFKPLIDKLQEELDTRFKGDGKSQTPEETLKTTLETIGKTTNDLLTDIATALRGKDPGAAKAGSRKALALSRGIGNEIQDLTDTKDSKGIEVAKTEKSFSAEDKVAAEQEKAITLALQTTFQKFGGQGTFGKASISPEQLDKLIEELPNTINKSLELYGSRLSLSQPQIADATSEGLKRLNDIKNQAAAVTDQSKAFTDATAGTYSPEAEATIKSLRDAIVDSGTAQRKFNKAIIDNLNEAAKAANRPLLQVD